MAILAMEGSALKAKLVVAKELNGDFVPSCTLSDVAPVGTGSERFAVASILEGLLSKGLLV